MELKLGVLNSETLHALLSGMLKASEHDDDCTCVECTAVRIAADDTPGKTPDDDLYVKLIKHSILELSRRGQRGEQAIMAMCAKLVELPIRPEFDHAMYQWRVDEYNARVRGVRTLFSLLPDTEQTADLTSKLPQILSWEKALEHVERTRVEIMEAVAKIKATPPSAEEAGAEVASELGLTLADIVNAARKSGKSDEEITAVLRNVADKTKDTMREAGAEASP